MTRIGFATSPKIPQLDDDPTSPASQQAWVLKETTGSNAGTPIGLLLSLTYADGGTNTYKHSYRTKESTTVRATLA